MCLSEESNYSDMLECGYFLVGGGDGMMVAEVSFPYPRVKKDYVSSPPWIGLTGIEGETYMQGACTSPSPLFCGCCDDVQRV